MSPLDAHIIQVDDGGGRQHCGSGETWFITLRVFPSWGHPALVLFSVVVQLHHKQTRDCGDRRPSMKVKQLSRQQHLKQEKNGSNLYCGKMCQRGHGDHNAQFE